MREIGIYENLKSHRISFHKPQVTDIERSFGICNRLLKYVKMKARTYIAYLRQRPR